MAISIRIVAIAAICCCAPQAPSHAAPQGILNKTITVSYEVAIPAKNSAGREMTARRSVRRIMYVSSTGRVFMRVARRDGDAASDTKEMAPGAADGAPRFEGDKLVGTVSYVSGAGRMVVSFDSSFQSCTATASMGRESGRALTFRGVGGDVFTASAPASVSTPSCSIQAGNAFAN